MNFIFHINNILDENKEFETIKESIDFIFVEFYKLVNLPERSNYIDHGTILSSGEALTPETAAGCVFDYVRTTKYLRAIWKAINTKTSSDKKIKILYAGSGPFASLIFPLLPLLKLEEIQVDIIDMHKESIASLTTLIEHFHFDGFFDDLFIEDATQFSNPKNKSYDIIITETMRHALAIEPQVLITLHLLKFLNIDGIFLPEKIVVRTAIANVQIELSKYTSGWQSFWTKIKQANAIKNRVLLGEVFILNKDVHKNYLINLEESKTFFLKSITVPAKLGKMKDLILLTDIYLYEDIILTENDETGLTKLYFDKDVPQLRGGEKLNFNYEISSFPKIVTQIMK